MKRISTLSAASLLGLVLAHNPAFASDAAMAKLTECMKLKPATPEQSACLKTVESLRTPPAKAKSTAAAPPAAPKAKSTAGSTTPVKVIEPPPEVKAAAAVVHLNGAPLAKSSSVGGIGGITVGDIKGLDLESAMLAVQSRRAELLESQLRGQLESVSKRNDEIIRLNTLIADLKKMRPAGTDTEKFGNLGANAAEGKANYARLQAAGVTMPTGADLVNEAGTGIYDAKQKTYDKWTEEIKAKIDSASNNQQMDMLRMQSLTNKRNEAFDLMTNFIKKMADSRSSVLGNMR